MRKLNGIPASLRQRIDNLTQYFFGIFLLSTVPDGVTRIKVKVTSLKVLKMLDVFSLINNYNY